MSTPQCIQSVPAGTSFWTSASVGAATFASRSASARRLSSPSAEASRLASDCAFASRFAFRELRQWAIFSVNQAISVPPLPRSQLNPLPKNLMALFKPFVSFPTSGIAPMKASARSHHLSFSPVTGSSPSPPGIDP